MAINEKIIRTKILEAIWAICPDSKRIRRNPLTTDRTKWAGLFRVESDNDEANEPIAHGWIVRRVGYKKAVKDSFDQFTFEILGFRSHDLGTDAENSEDSFQTSIDAIAKRLADKDAENPMWDFDEDEDDEATTEDLNFSRIGLIASSEFLHFAGGRLVVNIHRC